MMGHGTAVLLLTAAIGYWVLERASAQKKELKMVGQLVGTAIIVLSFIGVACKIYYLSKYGKGRYCPAGTLCPYSSQMNPQRPAGK